jgi:hypothetical protein
LPPNIIGINELIILFHHTQAYPVIPFLMYWVLCGALPLYLKVVMPKCLNDSWFQKFILNRNGVQSATAKEEEEECARFSGSIM